MPGNWDPQVYRERARQWRTAGDALPEEDPIGERYLAIADQYDRLAELIELDRAGAKRLPQS